MLRIYYCVVDKPDPHVIYHIMFHDVGETATGDAPYPVKHDNPTLKIEMDRLEQQSYYQQMAHWESFQQKMLTEADLALCKQIELVEMAEFGLDQMVLGNRHGAIVADRCLKVVFDGRPPPRLAVYVYKRLLMFHKQYRYLHTSEQWWQPGEWEYMTWEQTNSKSEEDITKQDTNTGTSS